MSDMKSGLRALEDYDRSVFDTVAAWQSLPLDRIMPGLSVAASYSRIWMGISAVLAIFGGAKGRRTAVEGMVAIGVTSFLANVVLKGLTDRTRPRDPVPEERSLEQPDSSSFPSGHTDAVELQRPQHESDEQQRVVGDVDDRGKRQRPTRDVACSRGS
jgi:undecaprenyl-diphosphatase